MNVEYSKIPVHESFNCEFSTSLSYPDFIVGVWLQKLYFYSIFFFLEIEIVNQNFQVIDTKKCRNIQY